MACVPALNRPVGNVCTCSGWGTKNDGSCDTSVSVVGQELFTYWCQNDCPTAYATELNNNNGELKFNPDNLPVVQNQLNNLFNTYNLTNTITPNTELSSYSPFQDVLLTTCLDERLPGACTTALNNFCGQYSRAEITANTTLNNFCGCYTTPDPIYNQITDFNQACDPVCNRSSTVQTADAKGKFNTCENTVCAISDVAVNLSQSEIGSVNFSNICPACPNNTCTCYISGADVNQTLSNIGVGTQFNNFCGTNSLCYNGSTWAPCAPVPPTSSLGQFIPLIIILGLILLTVFIIIILYAIKGAGYRYVRPGIYTQSPTPIGPVPQYSYQLTKQ